MSIKITYDKEADAAYIYLNEISPGDVTKTISLNESINIDMNSEGKPLGIEVLDASKNLPSDALNSAIMI